MAYDLAPMVRQAELDRRSRTQRQGQLHYATEGRDVLYNSPDGWEVEQPWLWWGADGAGGGDWPGALGYPIPGAGGELWGLSALPAVTRCTSMIADTLAGLPWHLFRDWERLETPAWVRDPQASRLDGRVADVDRAPEVRLSPVDFWSSWITLALWFGNAYIYVPVRDASGQPRPPVWLLSDWEVNVEDERYLVAGTDEAFGEGEIVHLRGYPPYVGGKGQGVLTRHAGDLLLAWAVRRFASASFRSPVPAGYLKVNAAGLTEAQAQDIKAQWYAAHGRGRRSVAVLNSTIDFQTIARSPVDTQLDRHREWSLRDMALAFGLSPWVLGIPGDSSTYANVESRMIELRQLTLLPWARRIESCLDDQVPWGQEFKVLFAGLERADTATRYAAYKTAIEAGFLTEEEVRAREDLPPKAEATMSDEIPGAPPVPVEGAVVGLPAPPAGPIT